MLPFQHDQVDTGFFAPADSFPATAPDVAARSAPNRHHIYVASGQSICNQEILCFTVRGTWHGLVNSATNIPYRSQERLRQIYRAGRRAGGCAGHRNAVATSPGVASAAPNKHSSTASGGAAGAEGTKKSDSSPDSSQSEPPTQKATVTTCAQCDTVDEALRRNSHSSGHVSPRTVTPPVVRIRLRRR
jgi:hypothetical protein